MIRGTEELHVPFLLQKKEEINEKGLSTRTESTSQMVKIMKVCQFHIYPLIRVANYLVCY